jgi:uracil-DNA glycosylase
MATTRRKRATAAGDLQSDLFGGLATVPTAAPAPTLSSPADVESLDIQADRLPPAWRSVLDPIRATDGWRRLSGFVDGERAAGKPVFPYDVFHALHLTPLDTVKVVILGQDPYHGTGTVDGVEIPQAHGLAFSVPDGIRVPPSLRNIYKEIAAEYDDAGAARASASGNLERWAHQGVLLLNTVLTVEQANAASHAKRGWEAVTDRLIAALAASPQPIVFLLWGSHAQAKTALIEAAPHRDRTMHLVLEAPHPSPLSAHRGFLGCGHFRAANEWLTARGREPVDWRATSAN